MLFGLAMRLSGDRGEAEELTQDAWVRAVERHDRYDGRARYATWVAGILVNCAREARRRAARTPLVSERQSAAADREVRELPSVARFRADPVDLERALAVLPDGFREIVILHDVGGFTHNEIASMLGIAPGTSKSQLARGRMRLRDLLEPGGGPDRDKRGQS